LETSRCGRFICSEGSFRFLLGVNYWPRKLNIRMWRDWDEGSIREDVSKMKSLGVRVVRAFIKCEDFADEQGAVRQEALERLKSFLDILWENGIQAFVTFIVGHMSGKNWRIPWAEFDRIYTPEAVMKTARFVEHVVSALKDHPAVAGWILSNELSLVRRASSREEAITLLRSFVEAVKRIDGRHVASSGDIPDSYMQETPNVADIVDYVGPHLYLYDDDEVRHGYAYGAMIELFSCGGASPTILEEFGFSTHQFSEEEQAGFINEVLYTALAHETSGAFVWCFSDFPSEGDPPYEWRPLELGFGLIRKDGSPKPAAEVFKRFSKDVERLESLGINTRFRRVVNAAVVIPFYMFKDYEFIWYRGALGFWGMARLISSAYTLLTASGAPASAVYELDRGRLGSYKLLAMPSTIVALTTTWRHMLSYTEGGGTLYASFTRGYGHLRAAHEAPTHMWAELFGIENTLRAGAYGRRYVGRIYLELVRDLGELRRGDSVAFELPEPVYTYTARPLDAEVLAVDPNGDPVLFIARRGKGAAIASLVPLELSLALAERFDWSSGVFKLYRAVAGLASAIAHYVSSNPAVEVQVFEGDGEDILLVINHGAEALVEISAASSFKAADLLGGNSSIESIRDRTIGLRIPRKGSAALLIHRR